MPQINEYLPFAAGESANTMSHDAWIVLTDLISNGFQPGLARSEQMNTLLRQLSTCGAGLAKFAADHGDYGVLDDGNVTNFARAILSAIEAIIRSNSRWSPGDVKPTWSESWGEEWLLADGSLRSRTEYAELFDAIGTRFGAGNGVSTFQLPDARALFLRGLDEGRGLDPSRVLGSFQKGTLVGWDQLNNAVWNLTTTSAGAASQQAIGADPYNTGNYAGVALKGAGSDSSATLPGGPTDNGYSGIARPSNIAVRFLIYAGRRSGGTFPPA